MNAKKKELVEKRKEFDKIQQEMFKLESEISIEEHKDDPKFTIKKFVFYSVDLEPISIAACKQLIKASVFNRISTNSIVRWEEVSEVKMFEEWHDDIKWNFCNTPIEEYEKLFGEKE